MTLRRRQFLQLAGAALLPAAPRFAWAQAYPNHPPRIIVGPSAGSPSAIIARLIGPQHIAGQLFKFMAGVDRARVPCRGTTPAVTDLLAGQVQVMFDVTPTSLPHIRAGKVRPRAVTTAGRIDVLPELPPLNEFLPGYEASAWIGFGVPKNTPAEVIAALNRAVNAAITDAKIKARIADLGGIVLPPGTPAEFGKLIADDIAKWKKVVQAAGLKPE